MPLSKSVLAQERVVLAEPKDAVRESFLGHKLPKQERYAAPAAELACRILQYLASFTHSHATLSEITSALGANKTTCLRVLRELERYRFVEHDPIGHRFSLGTYLFVLGNRAASHVDVLAAALPYLARAAKETGVTCVLVERCGHNQYMYIAKQEPASPIRVSITIGQRFPLTSGSHGKCILAFMRPDEAEEILRSSGLQRYTRTSITDLSAYAKALEQVRRRGYATSVGEHYPGINGVAAPIFDRSNKVNLTLTAIGTSATMGKIIMARIAETLKTFAASISASIQGHPLPVGSQRVPFRVEENVSGKTARPLRGVDPGLERNVRGRTRSSD
jgi:DNA-binding IclR family transcriptional regulator